MRDIPASTTSASNPSRSLGNASASTAPNALEMHEWPDGYEG